MGKARRGKGKGLLASSRPGVPQSGSTERTNLSSKATRTMIRAHHNLHKKLRQAEVKDDKALQASIKEQIEANGGLHNYQLASLKGQSARRGGDSSKVLTQWLCELGIKTPADGKAHLKMLEIGALKVDNACAKSGIFQMTRIDLHSRHRDILQQDFMQMSPPALESMEQDGFDIVSLSLVLNYVSHPEGRGDMLVHTTRFLREKEASKTGFPGLFLVLPVQCIDNSRYMSTTRLGEILTGIGYWPLKVKVTKKLIYYYFSYDARRKNQRASFPKERLRDGKGMNNFSIVLK